MESPPKPRRLRRLFGRLTAATLGAAAAGAAATQATPAAAAELDDDPRHDAAAHWFAISLERMEPLPATYTACQWALSPDPELRATVAASLQWPFRLVGDGLIIDHLSRDPLPAIRAEVARALFTRHAIVRDEVMARLAADPSPEVREVVQLAARGR